MTEPFHDWMITNHNGQVLLSIWNHPSGHSVTLRMTPKQANQFAHELIDSVAAMPRIGEPGDLGCEVL